MDLLTFACVALMQIFTLDLLQNKNQVFSDTAINVAQKQSDRAIYLGAQRETGKTFLK